VSRDANQRWNDKTLILLAADCGAFVDTFPTCANSTWTMYADSSKYFCCETGQVGVISPSEFDGLCEAFDQTVPSSLLATTVCYFPLCQCISSARILNSLGNSSRGWLVSYKHGRVSTVSYTNSCNYYICTTNYPFKQHTKPGSDTHI